MTALSANSLARWAAYLGVLLGVGLLVHGVQTVIADDPMPLPYSISVMIIGVLQGALSLMMLFRHRAAWSFIVSLNGTLFVVCLFGAPKIRDSFGVDLWLALIPCFLFGIMCTFAAVASDEFE